MRDRYLTVPKNEKGIEEYNSGIEHSDNLIESVLSEDEFDTLYHSGVFKRLNERCGLMIDDYESEIINVDCINKCHDIIFSIPGAFSKMADKAKTLNTILCLDF